jgi:hypothetical protein
MRPNVGKSFSALEVLGGGIALATVALIAVGGWRSIRPYASLPARPLHYATTSIEPSESLAKLSLQQSNEAPADDVAETGNAQSHQPRRDASISKPVESNDTIVLPPTLDHFAPVPRAATVELEVGEAISVQQQVIEAGSIGRFADAIWGPPSLDRASETRPADNQQRNSRNSSGAPGVPTFVGNWTDDIGRCPTGQKAPLVISSRAAKTARGECDFGLVAREAANRWRVAAICTAEGEFWRAHIALKLVEPRLTWSSERGATTYVRCNRG